MAAMGFLEGPSRVIVREVRLQREENLVMGISGGRKSTKGSKGSKENQR
jgi:hypothetical protein